MKLIKIGLSVLFVFISLASQADDDLILSVTSPQQAMAFADGLIEKLNLELALSEKEYSTEDAPLGSKENPLPVVHFGEKIPNNLELVLVQLSQKGVFTKVNLVTSEDALSQLPKEDVTDKALFEHWDFMEQNRKAIAQGGAGSVPVGANLFRSVSHKLRATKTFVGRFNQNLKRLIDYAFHIPGGFTFWVKTDVDAKTRAGDLKKAKWLGGLSAASMVATIYFQEVHGVQDLGVYLGLNEVTARSVVTTLAFTVWIYYNQVFVRSIQETSNQGRVVSIEENGHVKVGYDPIFSWPIAFARSLMTGLVVIAADEAVRWSFGNSDHVVSWGTFWVNSIMGVFARWQIDKYLASRTPSKRNQSKENWSAERAGTYALGFAVLYGFLKNLNLLEVPWLEHGFWGLVALNVGMLIYDMNIPSKVRRLKWSQLTSVFRRKSQASFKCRQVFSQQLSGTWFLSDPLRAVPTSPNQE